MIQLEAFLLDKIGHNKSRDPDGINRSIFQTNCIGSDLKKSLLDLFNKVKHEGKFPEFMKTAIITTIPKPGFKFFIKQKQKRNILSKCS